MMTDDSTDPELDILDLALRLRWEDVAAKANEAPEDIASIDQDGLNVLHWACCNHPPLPVFQSLLQHGGDSVQKAACTKDSNGMTPLLCACACRAPVEMIAALVDACPASLAVSDNDGWTALHYVCCRAKTDGDALTLATRKAELLLAADASTPDFVLSRDAFGRTALNVLCSLFEVELRCTYLFRAAPYGGLMNGLTDLWALVQLLVQSTAAARREPPPTEQPPEQPASPEVVSPPEQEQPKPVVLAQSTILHDICSFPDIPLELLMFACSQCPEAAVQQDAAGNTPLHICVQSQAVTLIDFLARNYPTAASVRNHAGKVPLSLAAVRFDAWNPVLHSLLCADATALRFLGVNERYLPILLQHINDDPSILFDILRSTPGLIQQSVQQKEQSQGQDVNASVVIRDDSTLVVARDS